MEDDRVLSRVHSRIDSLLQDLSRFSQGVARQETQIAQNAKDIDRLETKCAEMSSQLVRLETSSRKSLVVPKSKATEYAEKGGLVLVGGAVVELLRQLVQILQQ